MNTTNSFNMMPILNPNAFYENNKFAFAEGKTALISPSEEQINYAQLEFSSDILKQAKRN
jgi:hypothetical protein